MNLAILVPRLWFVDGGPTARIYNPTKMKVGPVGKETLNLGIHQEIYLAGGRKRRGRSQDGILDASLATW